MNIAKGNFHAHIPEVKSEDEIKRLHDSLVYMVTSLNTFVTELKTSTASNERFESELNVANGIQMQMLPKNFPHEENMDIYAVLSPAKEVGGDLYDFFTKGDNLFIAVGDVSGKGVPASMYMAITKASFRFITHLGLDLAEGVSKINKAFSDGNDSGMFVTLFVARINMKWIIAMQAIIL